MGGYRVPHRLHGLHVTVLRIVWVHCVLIVGTVHGIEFFGCQGTLGAVLYKIPLTMLLTQVPAGDRIAVVVEYPEGFRVCPGIGPAFLIGWDLDGIQRPIGLDRANPTDIPPIPAVPHPLRDLQGGQLRHTVDDSVRLGIQEDRPPDGIGPEIIVCHTSEAGLHTREDDRSPLRMLLDQVGVRYAGPVGTSVVHPSGSEVVLLAELVGGGVVGHHGIDTPCGHRPEELRESETGDIVTGLHGGLCDDPHAETVINHPMSD